MRRPRFPDEEERMEKSDGDDEDRRERRPRARGVLADAVVDLGDGNRGNDKWVLENRKKQSSGQSA